MSKKQEVLLSIIFPGIVQIITGNVKVGVSLLAINWFFLYVLWPVLMPISLGLTLRKDAEVSKKEWQKDLSEILTK